VQGDLERLEKSFSEVGEPVYTKLGVSCASSSCVYSAGFESLKNLPVILRY
jgi:hypothetical protein